MLRARQLLLVAGQPVVGEDVPLAVRRLDHVVGDAGADRDGQVRRQRPRRGGPGQDPLAGLELEPDRDRRVGPVGVDVVVHPQLVVGQRGLAPPAVGQHLEALVDQALLVQLLERPHDALHVGEVEGLVVVLEVDPAGLPGDVLLPLLGVAEHGVAARLVEGVDPHLEDVVLAGDAEQPLGLDLGRQAMAVPAEPPVDLAARHRAEARHDVLDVAGQQVPVVGQAVGERRAVVEDELAVSGGAPDRLFERAVGVPVGERPLLKLGEVRLDGYFGRAGARVGGHRVVRFSSWQGVPVGGHVPRGRRARSRAGTPRYHLACRLALGGRGGRSWPAVTGRTRPVLLGRSPWVRRLFFRGLPGDGRIIALRSLA